MNVTVRPGYSVENADRAVRYGYDICDRIARGDSYGVIVGDVGRDFGSSDEYQAGYLLSQAANELRPAQITRLRESAAGYRPGMTG
ncbi:DUF732 domain-containing protein [Mycolicibacterium sp.]|uniref:DUF732 domain-containing protein n=1 Tax=Mycolicibacterium sp. TaxID=2320850 RepID=UPI0037C51C45